jgi:hypothetical protein
MLTLTIIALISIFLMGAIMFIECKIIKDLPDSNEVKRWWKKHLIDVRPKD